MRQDRLPRKESCRFSRRTTPSRMSPRRNILASAIVAVAASTKLTQRRTNTGHTFIFSLLSVNCSELGRPSPRPRPSSSLKVVPEVNIRVEFLHNLSIVLFNFSRAFVDLEPSFSATSHSDQSFAVPLFFLLSSFFPSLPYHFSCLWAFFLLALNGFNIPHLLSVNLSNL